MAYLADTSALLEVLLGSPAGREISRLVGSNYKVSELSVYEMTRKRPEHEHLFDGMALLPFDSGCRREAAALFGRASRLGAMAGDFDIMIAGTALAHGLTIVTLDSDFGRLGVACKIFKK